MSTLSKIQEIPVYLVGDTLYDGTYLYCASDESIIAYQINTDGTLTEIARHDFGNGRLYCLAFDGTYIHAAAYSGSPIFACSFNGTNFTQHGALTYTGGKAMNSNRNGEIFTSNAAEMKRWTFDGLNYTNTHTVLNPVPSSVHDGIMADANRVLVTRHNTAGNTATLHKASDASILDAITLANPDGVYLLNDVAAIGLDNSFRIYDVSANTLNNLASVAVPDTVIDNVDYDQNQNFHIYLQYHIQHVYYNGVALILGDKLRLIGAGGRIYWNTSTNVGKYFYVTGFIFGTNDGFLWAVKKQTAVDADFDYEQIRINPPRIIKFTNKSTSLEPLASRLWKFPGGKTYTSEDVVCEMCPGNRSVTLTVTDIHGYSDSITKIIPVKPLEYSDVVQSDKDDGPAPLDVQFQMIED